MCGIAGFFNHEELFDLNEPKYSKILNIMKNTLSLVIEFFFYKVDRSNSIN